MDCLLFEDIVPNSPCNVSKIVNNTSSRQSDNFCSKCLKSRYPQLEAASNGHLNCLRFSLFREGLSSRDSNLASALHIAARKGQISCIQLIVELCISIEPLRSINNATPIHDAAGTGNLECLKYLMENTSCSPHDEDKNLATPLHWAAQFGHIDVVKWLVLKDHALLRARNISGLTPLHLASAKNKLSTLHWITTFIKNSNNQANSNLINAQSINGETSLYLASQSGHIESIKLLLEKCEASPYISTIEGLCPIHAASHEGHLKSVKILIQKMGNDLKSTDCATSLHYAASQGHIECVTWLLEKNICSCSEQDSYGYTPAHDAAEEGHLEILKILFLYGANFTITNEDNNTPLDLATNTNHRDCAEYIKLCLDIFKLCSNKHHNMTKYSIEDKKLRKSLDSTFTDENEKPSQNENLFPSSTFFLRNEEKFLSSKNKIEQNYRDHFEYKLKKNKIRFLSRIGSLINKIPGIHNDKSYLKQASINSLNQSQLSKGTLSNLCSKDISKFEFNIVLPHKTEFNIINQNDRSSKRLLQTMSITQFSSMIMNSSDIELMKRNLQCTDSNLDIDSLVSYDDENFQLIPPHPSQISILTELEAKTAPFRRTKRSQLSLKPDFKMAIKDIADLSNIDSFVKNIFLRLTNEQLDYCFMYVNSEDNPSIQEPQALVYLLIHYLLDTNFYIRRQYFIDCV